MLRAASAALLLRVAPGFEPHPPAAVERERERAAVAGREDIRIAGVQTCVDGNAVVDGEAGRFGEFAFRHGADADDAEVRFDLGPVGQPRHRRPPACSCDRHDGSPQRMCTPGRMMRHGTTAAISAGTPRIRMRGCASITVTGQPRARAAAASSRPMKPPPMIARRAPRVQMRADRQRVVEGAQVKAMRDALGQRQPARRGAGRQQQLLVRHGGAVGERDGLARPVDRDGARAERHAIRCRPRSEPRGSAIGFIGPVGIAAIASLDSGGRS